jgi:hypothetical protein
VAWNDNLLAAFSVVWGSSAGSRTPATSAAWGSLELGPDYDLLVLGDNETQRSSDRNRPPSADKTMLRRQSSIKAFHAPQANNLFQAIT